MLNAVRLKGAACPLYPRFFACCEASFPVFERRSAGAQAAAFADERYRLDAWLDGARFVGFMAWWDFGDYRYIEHVAVAPEFRSSGYGQRILRRWLAAASSPVYLEIEEPVDETTDRRRNFYLRLGFHDNPLTHTAPPYQGSGPGVLMRVLSYPAPMDKSAYAAFRQRLFGEVWAHLSAPSPSA